jgi:hypothetical protein
LAIGQWIGTSVMPVMRISGLAAHALADAEAGIQ